MVEDLMIVKLNIRHLEVFLGGANHSPGLRRQAAGLLAEAQGQLHGIEGKADRRLGPRRGALG